MLRGSSQGTALGRKHMPSKSTVERARADERAGKSPSTQAGELVREEIHHIREGKHGARSTKQAIAIGLSKAREAGVDLPPPAKGQTTESTRNSAARAVKAGHSGRRRKPSAKRSLATRRALKREGVSVASSSLLSRHARGAAARRRKRQVRLGWNQR